MPTAILSTRRPGLNLLLIPVLLLLTGCMQALMHSTGEDRPEWLTAEPVDFPNTQYITATGTAASAEQARDRALANLAKVFAVRIRESSVTSSDVQTRQHNGQQSVSRVQRLQQYIQTDTDKLITGARIAEQWFERSEASHHALAVLDRRQAGNNLRSEIERLDGETARVLQTLPQVSGIARITRLNTALDLQQQRNGLHKALQVIDLSGRGMPSRWSELALREQLQQALQQLRVALVIERDDIGGLDDIVSGAIAGAGIRVSRQSPAYILTASLRAEPVFKQQGWSWLRAGFDLRLSDAAGTVIGSRHWPLQVSSVRREMLRQRLQQDLRELLEAEPAEMFLDMLDGDN